MGSICDLTKEGYNKFIKADFKIEDTSQTPKTILNHICAYYLSHKHLLVFIAQKKAFADLLKKHPEVHKMVMSMFSLEPQEKLETQYSSCGIDSPLSVCAVDFYKAIEEYKSQIQIKINPQTRSHRIKVPNVFENLYLEHVKAVNVNNLFSYENMMKILDVNKDGAAPPGASFPVKDGVDIDNKDLDDPTVQIYYATYVTICKNIASMIKTDGVFIKHSPTLQRYLQGESGKKYVEMYNRLYSIINRIRLHYVEMLNDYRDIPNVAITSEQKLEKIEEIAKVIILPMIETNFIENDGCFVASLSNNVKKSGAEYNFCKNIIKRSGKQYGLYDFIGTPKNNNNPVPFIQNMLEKENISIVIFNIGGGSNLGILLKELMKTRMSDNTLNQIVVLSKEKINEDRLEKMDIDKNNFENNFDNIKENTYVYNLALQKERNIVLFDLAIRNHPYEMMMRLLPTYKLPRSTNKKTFFSNELDVMKHMLNSERIIDKDYVCEIVYKRFDNIISVCADISKLIIQDKIISSLDVKEGIKTIVFYIEHYSFLINSDDNYKIYKKYLRNNIEPIDWDKISFIKRPNKASYISAAINSAIYSLFINVFKNIFDMVINVYEKDSIENKKKWKKKWKQNKDLYNILNNSYKKIYKHVNGSETGMNKIWDVDAHRIMDVVEKYLDLMVGLLSSKYKAEQNYSKFFVIEKVKEKATDRKDETRTDICKNISVNINKRYDIFDYLVLYHISRLADSSLKQMKEDSSKIEEKIYPVLYKDKSSMAEDLENNINLLETMSCARYAIDLSKELDNVSVLKNSETDDLVPIINISLKFQAKGKSLTIDNTEPITVDKSSFVKGIGEYFSNRKHMIYENGKLVYSDRLLDYEKDVKNAFYVNSLHNQAMQYLGFINKPDADKCPSEYELMCIDGFSVNSPSCSDTIKNIIDNYANKKKKQDVLIATISFENDLGPFFANKNLLEVTNRLKA